MMISSKIDDIKGQVVEQVKKKCYEPYMWFLRNGNISHSTNGLELSVKDKTNKEEAFSKIKEFDKCITKNNLNIDNLLINIEDDEKPNNNYAKCSKRCLIEQDNTFEKCYLDCFNNYVKDMNRVLKDLEHKLSNYTV
jgi:hypothetical protein